MFFLASALFASVAMAGIRTESVKYQGNWIPSVSLNEVTVTATGIPTAAVCKLTRVDGELIASVEMNEITINASGNYNENELYAGRVKVAENGQLVKAVRYESAYIPQVNGPEITITPAVETAQADESVTTVSAGLFKVTVRQSFDRLTDFLVEKGRKALNRIVPGNF